MLRVLVVIADLSLQILAVLLKIALVLLSWIWRGIEQHQALQARKPHPQPMPQAPIVRPAQVKALVATKPAPAPAAPPSRHPAVAVISAPNPAAIYVLARPDHQLYMVGTDWIDVHPRSAELLEMVGNMAYAGHHRNVEPFDLPIAPAAPEELTEKAEPQFPLPTPDGALWIAQLNRDHRRLGTIS